jgi:xanthine dehydrogenase accessory factor
MDDLFRSLDALRAGERRVAMATLVATRGTSPRREGAKMWVGEGGRVLGSVTIGGCVDARVIAESGEVIAAGEPRLLSIALGDEDAWDLGLACSGTLDVLVEPVELAPDDAVVRAYDLVRAEGERQGRAAVVVVPLDGAPGGGARERLVVLADGSAAGSLGEPALDEAARRIALEVIRDGGARTVAVEGEGRTASLFFELHAPPTTLIVFGATHVAQPMVAMARTLGWRTVVVDGREHFATRDRFPDADELRIGILGDIAEQLAYGASTIVVLTAHDYKYELPVLRAVLARDPAYVGLLGSRRRGRAIRDFLRAEGVPDEKLRRIHVPVGLDIGARTAEEIALAVLAEAVAARAGRPIARRDGDAE